MAVQVGKLRTYIPKGQEKEVVYFKAIPGLHYNNLKELFDNIETDLPKHLSEEESYNIFYTVAHHLKGQRIKKSWQAQDIIPFDLDGIDLEQIDKYPKVLADACGFDLDKCAIVYTGNGCHVLVSVPQWRDADYIKHARLSYKNLYKKIKEACDKEGLPLDIDTTAWDYSRILRVPFTRNEKLKKQEDGSLKKIVKHATLIQNNLETQQWSLPAPEKVKETHSLKVGSFPMADSKEILKQCNFFKWLQEHPDEVHEPHAYAMLSITGHFTDNQETSKRLWESFSSPSINSKDIVEFTEQAMTASGPRTCTGIESIYGNCKACPHYQKVTSPIMLKGDDFIGTEHMGFSTVNIKSSGARSVKRCYEDLRMWYRRETNYIHIPNRRSTIMEFNGKFFEEVSEAHIKSIAQKQFIPLVEDDKVRIQFLNQVKASPDAIKSDSFIHDRKENLINLNNGILDIAKGVLLPHSINYGFTACMDYDYDAEATCPNWDAFTMAAMKNNKKLVDLLEEMLAFVLSGAHYNKFQFYFLLIGKGFNGKSTFITLLQKMLGHGNYTAHPLEDLIDKQDARAELATSLANLVADSSATALKGKDITRLKSWTGNDAVTGRALYKDSITFVNRAKFIFGFNDYPEIKATSIGDIRRIKAIPFNADFKGSDKEFFIKDLEKKLIEERSGILNKVITAHKRLQEKGFTHCEQLDHMKKDIRKSADSVYDFVTDFIEFEEGSKVFLDDMYTAYSENSDYSSERYSKEPRRFNKEVKSIIGTNDAFSCMEVKKVRLGDSTKWGVYNAKCSIKPRF